MPNELDRKDLKIIVYKNRVNELQEENADLRVELHVATSQLQEAQQKVAEYERPEVEEAENPSE
jgi:cytochrome c-type biogenesis protein CcmH/NrfG